MPSSARALAAAAALGLASATSVAVLLAAAPVGDRGDPPRVVYVARGAGAGQIAGALAEAGIIRSRWAFLGLAILRGDVRRLKPGEYEFALPATLGAVVARMVEGRTIIHLVTVPEGFTVRDLAGRLAAEGLADPGRIQALARDASFAGRLGLDEPSLEGYLFPDTYRLSRGMTEEEILALMVARFREVFGVPEERKAQALGLDRHAIVILASLIEKEARVDGERFLISAVFHNRLRRLMPLQADPSILYSFPEKRGRLTRADLRLPDPYNTYVHPGLPPGPIANPGKASILAALEPPPVVYLYFVAKADGTHAFSRTLAEHMRAVRKYQGARREEVSG
ncbi:MAG TPA: endolytic transglycosylase MltG [Candidatus Sulfotelmatobacter sp.]|nr:endolytic transglycosylase MltG [Candidatus Sulfotelmatobacter sp.]